MADIALTIPSANPTNFHQAISDPDAMECQDIWAKLFLPDGPGPFPVVIVPDAHHSFDRTTPLEHIADAAVTPGVPTVYIADDGAFIPPISDEPDPSMVDLDGFLYAINAGYGVRGPTSAAAPSSRPSSSKT